MSKDHDPLLLLASTRVAKRLAPGSPGTKRQCKVHGQTLVCVRYRHDPLKLYRYTTVELVVASAPIHPRRFDAATFGLHIDTRERELCARVRAAGARWDAMDRLWWLRGVAIREMGLVDRIVRT
jgi:hypothetical protein